jgi:hypothetical protein
MIRLKKANQLSPETRFEAIHEPNHRKSALKRQFGLIWRAFCRLQDAQARRNAPFR